MTSTAGKSVTLRRTIQQLKSPLLTALRWHLHSRDFVAFHKVAGSSNGRVTILKR